MYSNILVEKVSVGNLPFGVLDLKYGNAAMPFAAGTRIGDVAIGRLPGSI